MVLPLFWAVRSTLIELRDGPCRFIDPNETCLMTNAPVENRLCLGISPPSTTNSSGYTSLSPRKASVNLRTRSKKPPCPGATISQVSAPFACLSSSACTADLGFSMPHFSLTMSSHSLTSTICPPTRFPSWSSPPTRTRSIPVV